MNPLLKLLADNRGRGAFRAETSGEEATIYLYDAIVNDDFFGGVSASAFVKQLSAISAPTIHLRINCPGGDVFAGRAMAQAIAEHPSTIITHVDGYAASAASYVALAAKEVIMGEGAMIMIHNAWTIAWGNASDLRQTAELLDKIDESLVATYAARTGQDAEVIREWMAAETWFSAEEAVANGFADKCAVPARKKAQASAQWNLSAYSHAPEDKAPVEAAAPPALTFSNTEHLRRRLRLVERQAA